MKNPYVGAPKYTIWRRAIVDVPKNHIDLVVSAAFRLSMKDRVATAGSCFGQHIARYLQNQKFNYFVTEPAHPMLSRVEADAFNYGTYTARYGNIYTARQLLQLFYRAYQRFTPHEDIWIDGKRHFIDPFRPQIQPRGFESEQEYLCDRQKHFAAVRRSFEELDVFVFTLGLTEAWWSREDGAVYPLCPGVAGGVFDPKRYEFHNFTVEETVGDMLQFIDELRQVNENAKVILTVSPVPLAATAEDRHVLLSTTYSKSVLRVASENIQRARENVTYFPSYEIITGNFSRGTYFADDLRSITEAGVEHVMRVFFKNFTERELPGTIVPQAGPGQGNAHDEEMTQLVKVVCEEESLANFGPEGREVAQTGQHTSQGER